MVHPQIQSNISEAIKHRKICDIRYENNSGQHNFLCEPYVFGYTKKNKIVVRVWILDDSSKKEIKYWKLLRVDRIKDLRVTSHTFMPRNHNNLYNENDIQIENVIEKIDKQFIAIFAFCDKVKILEKALSKINPESMKSKSDVFDLAMSISSLRQIISDIEHTNKLLSFKGLFIKDIPTFNTAIKENMKLVNKIYKKYQKLLGE